MLLGQLDIHIIEIIIGPHLPTYKNSVWIINKIWKWINKIWKWKFKMIKVLEENTGEYLYDIRFDKDFLNKM